MQGRGCGRFVSRSFAMIDPARFHSLACHLANSRFIACRKFSAVWPEPPEVSRSACLTFRAPRGSKIQDVDRRVHVAIVMGAAFGTFPILNRKRQFFAFVTAYMTNFAGRPEAITYAEVTSIPGRLVFQLSAYFVHRTVADRPGKAPVLHHSRNVQVLDRKDSFACKESLPFGRIP